jgi:hypothetical protein
MSPTPPPHADSRGPGTRFFLAHLLAADGDVLGAETRRTGRFLMLGAVLLGLVATGLVRLESLPGLSVRVSGQALGIEEILVGLELGALGLYALYLAGDVQRVLLREYYARLTRVQLETDVRLRRLEETARLAEYRMEGEQGRRGEIEAQALPLRGRIEGLRAELEHLRSVGEGGSRFTSHAAQRTLVEGELRVSVARLEELEAEAASGGGASPEAAPSSMLPARLALSRTFAEELDALEAYRRRISESRLLRWSGRARSVLEIGLAPCAALASILLWGITR